MQKNSVDGSILGGDYRACRHQSLVSHTHAPGPNRTHDEDCTTLGTTPSCAYRRDRGEGGERETKNPRPDPPQPTRAHDVHKNVV